MSDDQHRIEILFTGRAVDALWYMERVAEQATALAMRAGWHQHQIDNVEVEMTPVVPQ